jgi:hypothetical protein
MGLFKRPNGYLATLWGDQRRHRDDEQSHHIRIPGVQYQRIGRTWRKYPIRLRWDRRTSFYFPCSGQGQPPVIVSAGRWNVRPGRNPEGPFDRYAAPLVTTLHRWAATCEFNHIAAQPRPVDRDQTTRGGRASRAGTVSMGATPSPQ